MTSDHVRMWGFINYTLDERGGCNSSSRTKYLEEMMNCEIKATYEL